MIDVRAILTSWTRSVRVVFAIARKDIVSSLTERTFTFISMVLPLNYLVFLIIIVSSGARAPIAVVMNDRGPQADALLTALYGSHSFKIHLEDTSRAEHLFNEGTVVGVVTVPATLDKDLAAGRRVALPVTINNLNVDFTDDIRRAIPLSITTFESTRYPAEVSVSSKEIDLRKGEPSYLQYIAVSSALIAIVLSGMLPAGTLAAREHEKGTFKTLLLAPASRLAIQCGHILAALALSAASVILAFAITIAISGVRPAHITELISAALLLMVLFVSLGNLAGNLLKRRPAVTPLCAGISVPLFVLGGALIPVSFSHPVFAFVAHFSPTYYGLAALQHAFYGVNATPQSFSLNMGMLVIFTAAAVALTTAHVLRYEVDH